MRYELQHKGTHLGTGSFAPVPLEHDEFDSGLSYLKAHPFDEFMYTYLLDMGTTFGPNMVRQLMAAAVTEGPHLLTLMVELGLLNERLSAVTRGIEVSQMEELAARTPLIFLRWSLQGGDSGRDYWLGLFADAVLDHRNRVPLADIEHPLLYAKDRLDAWKAGVVPIADLDPPRTPGHRGPSAEETWRRAAEALGGLGLKMEPEGRNPASLTPFALQINWGLEIAVAVGRHDWTLVGGMTSYGKGLSRDEARASCYMELVERVSAFADFGPNGPLHYSDDHQFLVGPRSNLAGTRTLLDPNDLVLEVPYADQALHWVRGEQVTVDGPEPIHVPAQLVFLFCNLDEVNLTSGLPSTGLASGNTVAEAKRSALLECIERDAERVMPYSSHRCFSLDWDAAPLDGVTGNLEEIASGVQFMDITTEFGVPCYKAFLEGPRGEVLKGCAADLDGTRALISALTELPYHPSWFRPRPPERDLPKCRMDSIPAYGTGAPDEDLALLESLLLANGYAPVYVNLTRQDLSIPVVKALIPGLELLPEFNAYSPLSLRQFAHYFYT